MILKFYRIPIYLILVLNVCIFEPAFPQSFMIHTYNLDDGLPGSQIYDAKQDSSLHMWFATNAGVISYDGHDWKSYVVHGYSSKFPIYKLEFDVNDTLWAVTHIPDLKIFYFDGNDWLVFETDHALKLDQPITFFKVFTFETGKIFFVGTDGDGLAVCQNRKWQKFSEQDGLPSNCINGIEMYENKVLVATPMGLCEYADGSIKNEWSTTIALEDKYIWGLHYERLKQRLWIVIDKQIGFIENDKFQYVTDNFGPDKTTRYCFCYHLQPDSYNGLYYGNSYALYYYNFYSKETIELGRTNGLLSEGLTSLFIDREKNVWITSLRGLSKLVSMRFHNYSTKHGLLRDEVSAIVEVEPNYFVFGHDDGITVFKNGIMTPIEFETENDMTDPETRVLDMTVDNKKNVWFVATNLGLGKIDENFNIHWYHHKNDAVNQRYSSIFTDVNGTIRLSISKKIYILKGNEIIADEEYKYLKTNHLIRKLVYTKDHSVYILTSGSGLFNYHKNSSKHYKVSKNSDVNDVYSVYDGYSDATLVGTKYGLYRTLGDSLAPFDQNGLRIDKPVYSILEDNKKRLWFGTSDGVIRWDGTLQTEFTKAQGFIGNEVNRSATIVDHDGNLWFGTDRGVSCFREEFDLKIDAIRPPKITLDHATIGGRNYPVNDDFSINYKQNSIAFHLEVVSFVDKTETVCYVKLEGIDEDWVLKTPGEGKDLKYIQLPSGTYRLLARAENCFKVSSPIVSSGYITVRKPFWLMWWFIISAVMILLFTGGVTFSTYNYRRYNRKLVIKVEERTKQLQVSQNRYRQMFENNRSIMLILNPETGNIIDANPSACDFYGYPLAQLKSSCYSQLCMNSSTDKFAKFPVATDEEFLNFISRHRLTSGEVKDVEIYASRLLLDEDLNLYLIVHDITERRKMELELLRINQLETIGILAGGIAHDFNNILTAIMGNVSLAKLTVKDNVKIVDILKKTLDACHSAKDLTRQLLLFSKGDVPSKELTSITKFVMDSSQFILRGTNVSCDFDIQRALWKVEVDKSQITQVMNNFIINAIQAMPHGGKINISVKNYVVDEDTKIPLNAGNYIRIDIADHGEGIAEDDLVKIFNPYYTTKKTGSGLGLTIAHSIISRHGGLITVNTQLGQGTTFTIYLPAVKKKLIENAKRTNLAIEGKGKILVMDDHEDVRNVAKDMLLKLGYEVECSVEGRQTIALYEEALNSGNPFIAVIIDLTIQDGMGGVETMQKLSEIDPGIKAVMSTGYYDDAVVSNFSQYGFKGILAKPYDIESMSRILHELLSN